MAGNYLISDAARQVKVEAHVLRYWEEELQLPIGRNELGHRFYTEADVERFREIKSMKERGLQLKAIRMILKNGKLDMLGVSQQRQAAVETAEGTEAERAAAGLAERAAAGSAERAAAGTAERAAAGTAAESAAESAVEIIAGSALEAAKRNSAQEGEIMEAKLQEQRNDIVTGEEARLYDENREEKAKRLQWLLQQLFRETLQENNKEMCRMMKENILKEMDYQFRMQEEKEEERYEKQSKQAEEHYKKIDELLRKKRRLLKK